MIGNNNNIDGWMMMLVWFGRMKTDTSLLDDLLTRKFWFLRPSLVKHVHMPKIIVVIIILLIN